MAMVLSACAGPAYYWQAAGGHLRLVKARQDVADLLANPGTDPALRRRLELAGEILDFANRELGLPADGSFSHYVAVDGPVTWNVIATPEFSLKPRRWCFPVAGCVSYRGYFDEDRAHNFAQKLRRRGLDVALFPAAAYSTLGWFDDPLLDTMLKRQPEQLAGLLLHELAHQRLYLRGDTEFSEAYASFVERAGVRAWLQATGQQEQLRRWERRRAAARDFDELLQALRASLAALYADGGTEASMRSAKAARFEDFRERYERTKTQRWEGVDHFRSWLGPGLNNARVALGLAYAGGGCAFAGLLSDAGGDFQRFHELAREISRRPAAARATWLRRPCPAVASADQL